MASATSRQQSEYEEAKALTLSERGVTAYVRQIASPGDVDLKDRGAWSIRPGARLSLSEQPAQP